MSSIEDEPEVKRWLVSAGYDQPDRFRERAALVVELGEFLDHVGKSPGEFVRSCLIRTKQGDTKISAKRRVAVQEEIERFFDQKGLSGHAATVAANHIRGFLIHNGIFMQGRASIG